MRNIGETDPKFLIWACYDMLRRYFRIVQDDSKHLFVKN